MPCTAEHRPMVEMRDLIRGVPPRHNLEMGINCPISIAAIPIHAGTAQACSGLRSGTGRSRGRGKQPRRAACAPAGRE